MIDSVRKLYRDFMTVLGSESEPIVAYYTDRKPDVSIGPKGGFFIDIKKPSDIFSFIKRAGKLDIEKKRDFKCMFGFLAQTRARGIPSVFDADNFGCPGLRFYLGFIPELPSFNHFFTSNGFPGIYNGERFFPTHASSRKRAKELSITGQKGKYVVFEGIEHMSADTKPEVVIFFENPETIAGLAGLVSFVTDEPDAVCSPFASGCGSIFSWPMIFARNGERKAVLGVFDPAARPWMRLGEMTMSIPYALYEQMLESYRKSFMYTDKIKSGIIKDAIPSWPQVRKRAQKIRKLIQSDTKKSDKG
jgi:hypothetical protein